MEITSVNSAAGYADASGRIPVKTLDQQDFLKLLVAQMKSQDPFSPQNDLNFIAQMAQFSTLEQSKSMQSDIAMLRGDQQLLQATALLGQTVEVQGDAGSTRLGTVEAVQIQGGAPWLVVDGRGYSLGQVLAINSSSYIA
jgi:flagellar basal-body rod modification protein FlgD